MRALPASLTTLPAPSQYVLSGAVHEFGLGSRFGALHDEVHRSNMSKACTTREEAERTIAYYAAKEQPARIEEVRPLRLRALQVCESLRDQGSPSRRAAVAMTVATLC